jgi:hypothetical protein
MGRYTSVLGLPVSWLFVLALVASCSSDRSSRTTPAETTASSPTAQVRAAYVAARQADAALDGEFALRAATGGAGFTALHPTSGVRAELDTRGVTLSRSGASWHATLAGTRVRCDGGDLAIANISGPRVVASANRAEYARQVGGSSLAEWYVHGPLGMEQGFTLEENPCGAGGDLVVVVRVEGLAVAADRGAIAMRDAGGATRIRYTDLSARDATGRALDAGMSAEDGAIALRVATASARFPVVIDPLVWAQAAELAASDGAADDAFGASVSVSGNIAIVGAPSKTIGGSTGKGAAYVFVLSAGGWSEQQELVASGGAQGDAFGSAVAVSGSMAVVGAPNKTVDGAPGEGVAYVFVQQGGTWTEQQELTMTNDLQYDLFGSSVALSGSTIVVGGPGPSFGSGLPQGAAYVFTQSGTTWTEQQRLTASDGGEGDSFGSSVAVSGDTALVGAYKLTVGSSDSQGSAYLFTRSAGAWTQVQELAGSDAAAGDAFGSAVALADGIAIVGAPDKGLRQGVAYVFVLSGTSWTQQWALVASDGVEGDLFGASVALSGTTAIVGAPAKEVDANQQQGAAYFYEQYGGTSWMQQQAIVALDYAAGALFGGSVALSGGVAVVGAVNATIGGNSGQGSAYIDGYGSQSGTTCTDGAECATGNCVDGYCCETACSGQCGACDVPGYLGFCTAVTGHPHGTRSQCPGAPCGGLCDGTDTATCNVVVSGESCGAVCANDQLTAETCDGHGACVAGATTACPNGFACAGLAVCGAQCSTGADCATGYACSGGDCVAQSPAATCAADGEQAVDPQGQSTDCSPYVCAAGACMTSCASTADCVAPNECNASRQCAPPATGAASGRSGGCSITDRRGDGPAGGALAFALAMATFRRRRRR